MFLGSGLIKGGSVAPAGVTLPDADTNNTTSSGICYAGLRFDNDGYVYERSPTGVWQNTGAWLLDGAAGDYYLWRTINTGTLTTDDGDGNILSTGDLDFDIQNSTEWFTRRCSITFKISDDAPGANIIVSKTYSYVAYREGTGSPP